MPTSSARPTRIRAKTRPRRAPTGTGTPQPAPAPGALGRGSPRAGVLCDIDLDVPAGRTIALVGATGSGKTSLVSLISRLYDPSAGSVLIDGADVRGVDLRSLRHAVAVVSDDPFLFSATVAENIAYARPEATLAEIELAARRAGQALSSSPACPTASRRAWASAG